eukprot:m.588588 g.588588  ORF g.588588 m.588588 type:complete len:791 (+) comp22365_c0_seq16:126-2498(+)
MAFRRGMGFAGFVRASDSGGSSSKSSSVSTKSAPQRSEPTSISQSLYSKRVDAAWSEHVTGQGQKYYYNSVTKESSWIRPDALGPEPLVSHGPDSTEAKEEARFEREEKRRKLGEDAYFDEDDDDAAAANNTSTAKGDVDADAEQNPFADEGIAAVVCPSATAVDAPLGNVVSAGPAIDDDEEDPLDAFMAGIEKTVAKEKKVPAKPVAKPRRDDFEDEDDQDTFFEVMAKRKEEEGDEEVVEYDDNGYPIRKQKESLMEVIPPVDHDKMSYLPIEKIFYEEHPDITALSTAQVHDLRRKLAVKVSGFEPPKPIVSFAHCGFDPELIAVIQRQGYSTPTPIQAQAVPIGLLGRDIIGIAKTGSGKTAAFVWPMLVHIMDQPELEKDDGPIGLVIAPTRELCQQIYIEAKKFGKPYNLKTTAIYGGGNRYEQTKELKEGSEIVVATPGRLIDLIKDKAITMHRCSFLVLDEADRMFNMGFEPQIRSIVNQIRPDRQTLLFSATFKKRVEKLARDVLEDPIRVVVGEIGEANQDVTQKAHVIHEGMNKWTWLTQRLVEFFSAGSVLVFVTKKANVQELAENLKKHGHPELLLLHGDMDQNSRSGVIADFKRGKSKLLLATDVASRGLDIPAVRTVVNFDVARDIDTHTHRIGRTGRAGTKGTAHTLVDLSETHFAGELVRNMEQANQEVPQDLIDLAMRDPQFKKHRKKGKNPALRADGGGAFGGGKFRMRKRAGLGSHGGSRFNANLVPVKDMWRPPGTGAGTDGGVATDAGRASVKSRFQMSFVRSSSST